MSFAQALERQQAAIFDRLGVDADWQDIGVVRIRYREADENQHLDFGEVIVPGRTIKVRQSQVPTPAEGQTVQLLDASGDPVSGGAFVVDGEPTLDRRGVWTCPVKPAA